MWQAQTIFETLVRQSHGFLAGTALERVAGLHFCDKFSTLEICVLSGSQSQGCKFCWKRSAICVCQIALNCVLNAPVHNSWLRAAIHFATFGLVVYYGMCRKVLVMPGTSCLNSRWCPKCSELSQSCQCVFHDAISLFSRCAAVLPCSMCQMGL